MAITVGRTVRYWTYPPKETALILDALTAHPGACLRLTPFEDKAGEPQLLWSVVADAEATLGGDPPGGNNSQVCPPVC